MNSYDNYSYSYTPPEKPKTTGYMGLSLVIHAAFVAAISVMGIQQMLEPQPEGSDTVVIEFEPTQGEQTEYKEVAPSPLAETTKTAPSDESSIPVKASKSVKPVIVKAPSKKAAKPVAKAPPKARPQVAKVKVAEPISTVEESDTVVPTEEEVMPTPMADLSKELDENEINKELDDVAERLDNTPVPAAALSEMDETEKELENEREQARLEAISAQEQAAAKKEALAAARADAARKAGAAALAASQRNKKGAVAKTNQAFGVADGIRSIDDLKQRPGNIRPAYDLEDRRTQRQGFVNFVAYVTRDGSLTKFKMTQSTGHSTLDNKTFAALRKWKFLPGQEGWVEIPFNWSLKGEAQEAPVGLRRKVGQK